MRFAALRGTSMSARSSSPRLARCWSRSMIGSSIARSFSRPPVTLQAASWPPNREVRIGSANRAVDAGPDTHDRAGVDVEHDVEADGELARIVSDRTAGSAVQQFGAVVGR